MGAIKQHEDDGEGHENKGGHIHQLNVLEEFILSPWGYILRVVFTIVVISVGFAMIGYALKEKASALSCAQIPVTALFVAIGSKNIGKRLIQ